MLYIIYLIYIYVYIYISYYVYIDKIINSYYLVFDVGGDAGLTKVNCLTRRTFMLLSL